MKKFVTFFVCAVLALSLSLSLIGCGSDLSARIDQLERDLAQAQDTLADLESRLGIPGPTGPQGPAGPKGEPYQPELNKIYQLGETFTYISHGLELFSVKVERDITSPTGFSIFVTNHNMPGLAPNDFIRGRAHSPTGFLTFSFVDSIVAINAVSTTFPSISSTTTCIWLGTPSPTSNRAMTPFVRFNVEVN